MSQTIKWSFSADRCVRRCQRQYFLQHVAAWHNSRDWVRREAFLSKQVKTLPLWQGSLVHRAIELFVVPTLQEHRGVDWGAAIAKTLALAGEQLRFSKARRYREEGMTKTKAGDAYCALACHETDARLAKADFSRVREVVERSLRNLSHMRELLAEIKRADRLWPELVVDVDYDIARMQVRLDLLFFRSFGKPTIIDWKVSESMGGSDADLQTALYAWAMCRHPKWRVDRPDDCELIEVRLLSEDVIRHRANQRIFDSLENRIYRSLNMIQSLRLGRKYDLGDITDYEFAGNPNSCVYCPQRKLCQELAINCGSADHNGLKDTRSKKEGQNYAETCPQLF